jgi:hypothetical protein
MTRHITDKGSRLLSFLKENSPYHRLHDSTIRWVVDSPYCWVSESPTPRFVESGSRRRGVDDSHISESGNRYLIKISARKKNIFRPLCVPVVAGIPCPSCWWCLCCFRRSVVGIALLICQCCWLLPTPLPCWYCCGCFYSSLRPSSYWCPAVGSVAFCSWSCCCWCPCFCLHSYCCSVLAVAGIPAITDFPAVFVATLWDYPLVDDLSFGTAPLLWNYISIKIPNWLTFDSYYFIQESKNGDDYVFHASVS